MRHRNCASNELQFCFNVVFQCYSFLTITLKTGNLHGVPHDIRPSMGLNNDFRHQSENLKRIIHVEKLDKDYIIIFLQKMLGFSSIMCLFWR